MKKASVIIVIFGFWCLGSALWYMFLVRGASDPGDTGLAIAEIIIMTLISVLLGFGIAWYMREDNLRVKQNDVQALLTERSNILVERNNILAERSDILKELQVQRVRAKKAEHTLDRARQTFHDDYLQVSRERDHIKEERSAVQNLLSDMKDEYTLLQIQLSNEQEKVVNLINNLKVEQQQAAQKEKENAGVRYFINPFSIAATIEKDDIDDLKIIKGIGPVIEKKLNMLGIVSFKQISELNEEALDQVAYTLKFFPDRIKRDNWVQQARELSKSK